MLKVDEKFVGLEIALAFQTGAVQRLQRVWRVSRRWMRGGLEEMH